MNRKSEEIKEKQISEVMASIENRVIHAYNQSYEQGLKASKQEPCEKMTREEAIKMLNGMKADNLNLADLYTKNKYDALEMAINALEQEPILDKIRAEIEYLDYVDFYYEGYYEGITDAMKIVEKYRKESEKE